MYSDPHRKYIVDYTEYITRYNKNTYTPKHILAPAAEYTHNILEYRPQYTNNMQSMTISPLPRWMDLKPPVFRGALNSFNASSKSHTSNKWLTVQM